MVGIVRGMDAPDALRRRRTINRRKKTIYASDSVLEFLAEHAERLGVSENWLISWSLLRNRKGIESIASADDLLAAVSEWPAAGA